MVRTRREPGINCRTVDYVAREKYIKTAPFLTNVSGCVKGMASTGPEMCPHDESKR